MENMAHLRLEERPSTIPPDELEVFDPYGDVILQLMLLAEVSVPSPSPLEADDHQETEATGGGDTTPATLLPLEASIDQPFLHLHQPTHATSNSAIDGRAPESEREGDLMLENRPSLYLRVSSRHLALASSIFHVMLDPSKFAEGNTLHSQGSLTIPLSDDPDVLIILMHIIHGMTRKVPRFVTLDTLSNLARLVDYYQLHEVVELFSDTWVANLKEKTFPNSYTPDVVPWLFISWVFHKKDEFLKLTQILICECDSKPIDAIDYKDIPIPFFITDNIQKYRIEAIDSILTIVHDQITTYLSAKIICSNGSQGCDANVLGSLLKSSAVVEIWPRPDVPYHDIAFNSLASQIKEMQILDFCTYRNSYHTANHGVKDMIQASLKSVEDQFCSLSWDSFLLGPQNKNENKDKTKWSKKGKKGKKGKKSIPWDL